MDDRELLANIRDQLYRWAAESRRGGWSTHQVKAQCDLASRIGCHLATTTPAEKLDALAKEGD